MRSRIERQFCDTFRRSTARFSVFPPLKLTLVHNNNKIITLFTLGSIYSAKASGEEQMTQVLTYIFKKLLKYK